jgi:hypothetical protein
MLYFYFRDTQGYLFLNRGSTREQTRRAKGAPGGHAAANGSKLGQNDKYMSY